MRTECQCQFLPHDFTPGTAVFQHTRRWLPAGAFQRIAHEVRVISRFLDGRHEQPTGMVLDGRTLQSSPESGGRAGYDGAKKKKVSKGHAAEDTLGNLLAMWGPPANEPERAQVAELGRALQEWIGGSVEAAFADQSYTGKGPAWDSKAIGIRWVFIDDKEAHKGFVLTPRCRVVERNFG